jgi:uncharacterized protein with von Willebrand factor type A (vWA) domain
VSTIRYTAWDGRQRIDLVAPKVLERLGELLAATDDVGDALQWLLRRGADLGDLQIQGLDQMLQALRDAMRSRQRSGHLGDVFDALRAQLADALALERLAVDRLDDAEDRARRRGRLDATPERLSRAIEHLTGYDFLDPDAAAALAEIARRLDDIRRVEDLVDRMHDRFRGQRPLSFEDALDLLEEIERWEALEAALASGDLDGLDPALLSTVLGSAAAEGLELLRGMLSTLWDAGYLTSREGRVRLSPLGVRRIGQMALREIYKGLLADRSGGHPVDRRGAHERRLGESGPWRYGEPLDLDLVGTLKGALVRGGGTPIALAPDDVRVFPADRASTSATVLLLDMSWSMSWDGRFAAAKRVALALEALIRGRFPRDYFGVVGFYTRAVELSLHELPEASWNMGDPFTNLQDGLRLAATLLRAQRTRNKQVIVVTDGQPTAYFIGRRLHCEWPLSFGGVSVRAARETLREVQRVTREGIVINTFMLDDSPSLRRFVEEMTRINRGRALYTRPDRLGEYLLVDYLARKRTRV